MHKFLRFCCQVIFVLCIFNYCIDGFSIGRSRFKRQLSKRVEKNGFDYLAVFNNMKNGYQYLSTVFNNGATEKQQNGKTFSAGSSVANCDDCFLGMQISRREAYVVS